MKNKTIWILKKNRTDVLFYCVPPWFSFFLIVFYVFIFQNFHQSSLKWSYVSSFSELGKKFVCIFFYPLNHKVMGNIKVSNVCVSVQHMKPPWNSLCICLTLKHGYIFVTDYAVPKKWGFCSLTPLPEVKIKLKYWHELLAWEYVILGFDDCLGRDEKIMT